MKQINKVLLIIVISVVLVALLFGSCFFILEEGFQAITLRFRKIENVYTDAGLKFKLPWDTAQFYSKKILSWDGRSEMISTQQPDSQLIFVNTTARWKIVDAKRFYEKLGDKNEALKKLDDILDSVVKTVVGNNLLTEAIRSTRTPVEFAASDFKNIPQLLAYLLNLSSDDLTQAESAQLSSGSDTIAQDNTTRSTQASAAVSRYINTRYMTPVLRSQFNVMKNANQLSRIQEEVLAGFFNKLLTDTSLYEEQRFKGIVLIDHASILLKRPEKTSEETALLNRILLEASYPQNIAVSPVKKGRESLSREMVALAQNTMHETDTESGAVLTDKNNKPVNQFGIELIDIVIRQIKYSDALKESIYQTMIKERNQIAEKIRSEGLGAKNQIEGKLFNDVEVIRSKANRDAEEIKGKADAEATKVYASAYEKNREFFKFWRSLESYKTLLPKFNKTLSTDADYFDYLYNQNSR